MFQLTYLGNSIDGFSDVCIFSIKLFRSVENEPTAIPFRPLGYSCLRNLFLTVISKIFILYWIIRYQLPNNLLNVLIIKFVIINEIGENICSRTAVNLDGPSGTRWCSLLFNCVSHKPSDVLFKFTGILL